MNRNLEKWNLGKMQIRKYANLEKCKFGKIEMMKGNRKNKKIWINKNKE